MDKWDPKWNSESCTVWPGGGPCKTFDNYWAGAKKACDDIGMSLPDKSKLKSIYEAGKKDSSLGLPTSGWLWSSSENTARDAYSVDFGDGFTNNVDKYFSDVKVLCVGD